MLYGCHVLVVVKQDTAALTKVLNKNAVLHLSPKAPVVALARFSQKGTLKAQSCRGMFQGRLLSCHHFRVNVLAYRWSFG